MRDHLIAFIKGVQEQAAAGGRQNLTLGSLFGTGTENEVPSMEFGYGYHQPDKVRYKLGRDSEELPVEEAVDRFLQFYRLVG